jgi:hypothetical protein
MPSQRRQNYIKDFSHIKTVENSYYNFKLLVDKDSLPADGKIILW